MNEKNTTNGILGQRIKELRKAHGWTLDEFVQRVGISKSAAGYYENDGRMPDAAILTRIADAFNVSTDYLLGRTNTAATKGKMKTVCDVTGLSDKSAEFLSEIAGYKRNDIIAFLNFMLEDYADDYNNDYNNQMSDNIETPSSILNAVIHYLREYSKTERSEDYKYDISLHEKKMICAYKQLLLNRVSEAVKESAEVIKYRNMRIKREKKNIKT